jgi:hypothetical protein
MTKKSATEATELEALRFDVKTITYSTIVTMLREDHGGLTMSELCTALAEARRWSIETKGARAIVRTHVWGLLKAGMTVGEIDRDADNRYTHLTPEERTAAAKAREERAAIMARVHATVTDLGVGGVSVTDQHVVMSPETFLELCE